MCPLASSDAVSVDRTEVSKACIGWGRGVRRDFNELFDAGTLLPPMRAGSIHASMNGCLIAPYYTSIYSLTPNPRTPRYRILNDKGKKPAEVVDFPSYDAPKARFGPSMFVVSTWCLKCRPGLPEQGLACMGKIANLQAHYNAGKNEVEIHTFCESIQRSWQMGYRPPRGYRKNANE